MSQEMAKQINDGLFDYEDELWDPSEDDEWVSVDMSTCIMNPTLIQFSLCAVRLRQVQETNSPMSVWSPERTLRDSKITCLPTNQPSVRCVS